MFNASKPFFLGRGNDNALYEQGSVGVVAEDAANAEGDGWRWGVVH